MKDDFFDVPELDVFESEVQTLVIQVYDASIAGVNRLDKARCPDPDLDANPELQVEVDWWDREMSAMKRHAGNMGLVSLVTLFDDWLARKYKRVFPNKTDGNNWKSRFEQLENHLQRGTLSPARLEELFDARNSIIHHSGRPEFEWPKGKPHKIAETFLGFDEVWGDERVAIEGAVLTSLVNDLASHVKRWNRE